MNIGRNDPCPCNSGKKYKKCCLPIEQEKLQEIRRKENELNAENLKTYMQDLLGSYLSDPKEEEWLQQDIAQGQENLKEYENKLDLVRAV